MCPCQGDMYASLRGENKSFCENDVKMLFTLRTHFSSNDFQALSFLGGGGGGLGGWGVLSQRPITGRFLENDILINDPSSQTITCLNQTEMQKQKNYGNGKPSSSCPWLSTQAGLLGLYLFFTEKTLTGTRPSKLWLVKPSYMPRGMRWWHGHRSWWSPPTKYKCTAP